MEIDGFYLFVAGEIGIGIFIIMSRLTDTFDRIWDFVYPKVVFIIFSGLIPLMIWGFFAQYESYQKDYSQPSWLERRLAQQEIMIKKVLKEDSLKKSQPVQKREAPLPPQIHNPEDNNFSIPLQQLLEGNHGRFL